MGKIVVLAEKPSVGRELAKILKCHKKNIGFIEGDKYIVTWALGHLVTLAPPEKYDKTYEKWKISDLPIIPEKMKLEVIKQTKEQFDIIKKLLKDENTESLIIATDAGREGEVVARRIIKKASFKKPIKRLWISSQTEKAIKEGFEILKEGKEYENLYQSGECRAEADWVVGLNISRALTCKYKASLSAGRVQTPTLYMMVERENEINNFKPTEYYTLDVKVKGIKFKWKNSDGEAKFFDEIKIKEFADRIKNCFAEVTDVEKTEKSEPAPKLYDLTSLQQDANKVYKYSAKETLSVMQTLYERHKIVTYPRTDSRYLSDDLTDSFSERLLAVSDNGYEKIANRIDLSVFEADKRFIDNSKVTDHHAIIPTEQRINVSLLTEHEKNIYDLVVKRFLCMFQNRFSYMKTSVCITLGNENFYANGRIITDNGWKNISDYEETEGIEEETEILNMPEFNLGEKVKTEEVLINKSSTKPPVRYTEATILYAMEHAGKFVKDDNMKDVLKSVSGIGTPATRADIIEKLVSNGSVERVNNSLVPTEKAYKLIELVPDELKSPELTAKWEERLLKIASGQEKSKDFSSEIRNYTTGLVKNVLSYPQKDT